ncbi:MAG: GNAT family N-acetyltransferase [Spirulina sp.]
MTSKFMVLSSLRGRKIGLKMLQASYKQFLQDGIKFDFIDCEPYMKPFYQKLGYQSTDIIDHPEYGRSIVLMLDILNLKHLETIKSPFQDICKNFLKSQSENSNVSETTIVI